MQQAWEKKMLIRHINRFLISAVCAALFCVNAQVLLAQVDIESGEWVSDDLSTNAPSERATTYIFSALPNETVIIRLGHADHDPYPSFEIYNPGLDHYYATNSVAAYTTNNSSEYHMMVTNYGWYSFVCSIPGNMTTMTYNCSMLRTPNIALCKQDLDVGTLQIGESKVGTINVGSDLDAGFFAVTNSGSTMQIRMGQLDYPLVPNIQIYDPNGALVTNDFPTDYRSEITATNLINQGIYTVVCSDMLNAEGQYALTMVQIPGTLSGSDTDFGPIISGEKKNGTINQPGDLDLASFSAVNGDVVSITMTKNAGMDLNPVLELYGPNGERLARTTDVFETSAVIPSCPIVSNGVYSIICKDKLDRSDVSYTLEMDFMAGSPSIANLPVSPTTISASQGTYSNRIDVTWNAADGATGYDLWRSYGTNSAVQIYTNVLTTSYADYDVTSSLHYYYKVRSRNTYGTSTNFSPSAEGYCGTSAAEAGRKFILVGIDNYASSYGPTPLTTCTNDAIGMRDTFFLGDPSNRWSSTNMIMYTDRQATKLTIQNALHSWASASSAGDIVVYVHSSHGGTTGSNSYLCTYDADYTAGEFGGDLTLFNSETKIIVILDACYSGGMYRFKNTLPPPWTFAEEAMANYRQIKTAQFKSRGLAVPKELGQNIAFMTACDYDEFSYTSDYYSRYIGYLIKGCSVQSVDTNNNGQYNFLEMHSYAAVQSMAETPSQHAQSFHPSLLESTIARAVGTNQAVTARIKYNDFDGDGFSDIAVYNTANGAWRIGSVHRWLVLAWDVVWGGSGFIPINGDYDGDRTTDLAVYNETQGLWCIASLSRWAVIVPSVSFGGPSLTPVSGDYNGDGIYDFTLYQDPEGFWYVVTSAGVPLLWGTTLTGTGFVPVSGDYDGDFISDLAMYSPSSGYWYIMSMTGTAITWGTFWGVVNATPVSGDYDGDHYSDLAVYQESTGLWYIWSLKRSALIANALYFGGPGFLPVPGDYDGDGTCDLVLYQESTGNWYLRNVSGSLSAIIPFGGPGYIPVLPTW